MDNLVFEESINTEVSTSEFVDKQWLYVNDNNNSSYTGQITIDTTSLSNCGNWINWSEAYLALPMVLQTECAYGASVTTGQGTSAGISDSVATDFAVGLKNGYWQIIHSLTVEFNNGNIVQQTPFLNVFSSFKNQTSWSLNDVKDWGAVCGFAMDSADSWCYNNLDPSANILNIINSSGTGLSNNRNSPYVQYSTIVGVWTTTPGTTAGSSGQGITQPVVNGTQASDFSRNKVRNYYNKGFLQRQKWMLYENQLLSADSGSSNKVALISGAGSGTSAISGFSTIFESYCQRQTVAGVSSRAIIFQAIIRLKDICDFFHKAPLMKGSTFRMYINTNQTYFTVGYVNQQVTGAVAGTLPTLQSVAAAYGNLLSAGALYLSSSPVILGGGSTNPLLVASMDIGQGGANLNGQILTNSLTAAAPTILSVKVGLSIVKTQFQQFTVQYSAPITSTRLYAPAYTMSPQSEQRFLNLTPTKKIVYNDIFYYTFTGVAPGQFNFLVSNGLPNLRSVLVVPLLPKASNGVTPTFTGGVTSDTITSPFSTTGGTPDPISLTNFQIQISGKNLFINNELYDYEQFTQQLVSSNQLNGSLTTSLSSGLIGYSDFEGLYRWYYGRADRVIPSEFGVARAVQVLGTNNSTQTINFIVFCEFEREITIDLRNGARIQ